MARVFSFAASGSSFTSLAPDTDCVVCYLTPQINGVTANGRRQMSGWGVSAGLGGQVKLGGSWMAHLVRVTSVTMTGATPAKHDPDDASVQADCYINGAAVTLGNALESHEIQFGRGLIRQYRPGRGPWVRYTGSTNGLAIVLEGFPAAATLHTAWMTWLEL